MGSSPRAPSRLGIGTSGRRSIPPEGSGAYTFQLLSDKGGESVGRLDDYLTEDVGRAQSRHSQKSTSDRVDNWLDSMDDALDSSNSSQSRAVPSASSSNGRSTTPMTTPERVQGVSIMGKAARMTPRPSTPPQRPGSTFIREPPPHQAHLSIAHDLPERAVSPANSAAGVSNLSSNVTKVSVRQAAEGWQRGQIPKPIERDGVISGERASRYQPDLLLPSNRGAAPPGRNNFSLGIQKRNVPARQFLPIQQISRQNGLPSRPPGPGMTSGLGRGSGVMRPQPTARNFEIKISDIPTNRKKDELYELLAAEALHRYPFSPASRPLNFWLHLPRPKESPDQWGHSNDGFAYLTLPTLEDAIKFMRTYGRGAPNRKLIRPQGASQPLSFEAGTKPPPAGLLEWLRRAPYPEKGDRSARVVMDRKASNLQIERMEFGVFCRDGVFSCEHASMLKEAYFSFDSRHRNFRLLQRAPEDLASGLPPSVRAVVIRASAIRLVMSSEAEDEFSVTVVMHHPPAYEELRPQTERDRPFAGRHRKPAWDEQHMGLAPFTSRVIRFVFDTSAYQSTFEELLSYIGCPNAKYVHLEQQQRELYSTRSRKKLSKWLESLESRAVAFQLARLYQNNLLSPAEVLSLKPFVDELYGVKGSYSTADVLQQYVEEMTKLEDRWYDRILKDATHIDYKDLTQGIDILKVLRSFETKGLTRVNWQDNFSSPVMQCLHVILTPTSMLLEGPYPDQSNRPLR